MAPAAMSPRPQGPFPAQRFCDESERLRVIANYGLDGLKDDPALADLVGFAARLCAAPIALVSMVEDIRQRFIARTGLDASETPRSTSFCAHAMLGDQVMVVCDAAAHPQFSDNPLVTGAPFIRFYAGAPLVSREGAPLGALCVIDDKARPFGLSALQAEGLQVLAQAVMLRIERRRSEQEADHARAHSRHRFRTILNSLPDIAWSANAKGEITYINQRWTDYTGLPNDDLDREHIRSAYHPDEKEPWRSDWLAALRRGEPYEGEYRLRRQDGTFGWILARAVPVHNQLGEVESWFGQLLDIDERHRRREARDLLARELAHRIKNIFAVIGGLVSLRTRGKPELKPFAEELIGSIQALGRAQDFVRPPGSADEEDLADLLTALMAPYCDKGQGKVSIKGHGIVFGARAASPLALVFHELATNAAKYGALSDEGGEVAVTLAQDGDEVRVDWCERGGPPVAGPPEQTGFGSRLIGSVVKSQLGGRIEQTWLPAGLALSISLPRAILLK